MLGVLRSRSYGLSRRLLRATRGPLEVGVDVAEHALAEGRDGVGLLHLLPADGADHDVNHETEVPLVGLRHFEKVALFLMLGNGLAGVRAGLNTTLKLSEDMLVDAVGHIVSL